MSKQQLKTIRPIQYDEPRRKKPKPIVVDHGPKTIKRPPAVYSNRSHEQTLQYYENLKIDKHVSSKFPRRKRN